MFLTSLTAAAVAGMISANSLAVQPDWADSYGSALAKSGERNVPVAVFIAPGGLAKWTNGDVGADALKTLKASYVAVQVDPTTESGKAVAARFGMAEGVVLSDATGKTMALKHEGKVSPAELSAYLTKYADGKTVANTEVHSAAVPVTAPTYQPQYYPAPGYGGGYSTCPGGNCGGGFGGFAPFGGFGFGGGCANGRCGR